MQIWQEIVSVIVSNGVFAILFVALFFYQLKDSKKREEKYQKTIDKLTVHIGTIEKIKDDVEELKEVLMPKRRKKQNVEKSDSLI